MKYKLILVLLFIFSLSEYAFSQEDKLFYNRIHYFEHQECQHPIGTVIKDKVFFANNTDNSSYMNFNNSDLDTTFVDLINYEKYTAFNNFLISDFLAANKLIMGFRLRVPNHYESVKEARSQFKLDKVKDSIVNNKTLKHIRIVPKDTLVHRFKSYNILINTDTKSEIPLYTSPEIYFLLKGSLQSLRGTIVETFFIDLEGYWFCRDVLAGFQVTNKRVIVR